MQSGLRLPASPCSNMIVTARLLLLYHSKLLGPRDHANYGALPAVNPLFRKKAFVAKLLASRGCTVPHHSMEVFEIQPSVEVGEDARCINYSYPSALSRTFAYGRSTPVARANSQGLCCLGFRQENSAIRSWIWQRQPHTSPYLMPPRHGSKQKDPLLLKTAADELEVHREIRLSWEH